MSLIRVPTHYSQHRSDSGRIASGIDTSDEEKSAVGSVRQLQNIPKALRDIFVPAPGNVFVGGDWAGIEWAIMIWLAHARGTGPAGFHEELLDRFFEAKFDPHCWLAAHAFGLDYEDLFRRHKAGESLKPRKLAKPYTHGYDYEGSPEGLAKSNHQPVEIGRKVCTAHDKAFLLRDLKTLLVAEATERGYAQTEAGFRRYFWDPIVVRKGKQITPKPSEILSHYGSGNAADLCKWELGNMYEELPANWCLRTTTHDSFVIEVPEPQADDGAAWLLAQMQRAVPFLGGRRWRADVRIGRDWRSV